MSWQSTRNEKIRIEGLNKVFLSKQGEVHALKNINLTIPGRTDFGPVDPLP